MPPLPPKPELLAPAGDETCAFAAVENGADAVYFGASRFNARARANNFSPETIPDFMRRLHRRGVRGYVTFNILLFTDELASAKRELVGLMRAGVDAAIVQDVGACRLIRAISPDFPIHASTQMSLTGADGLDFARRLGASLAVVARENSVEELAAMRAHENALGQDALRIETFVHGALCVAYSGQCLTSEALGGRSANRGECAQACRMPYELIVDGVLRDMGPRKYLLSPRDLAGIGALPDLIRAGVSSLKIEGRLKSAAYVANVTRAYREALDRAYDALLRGETPAPDALAAPRRYELEMGFSRGLSTGWLYGIDNTRLVHARFAKKRGVKLGVVAAVRAPYVYLEACAPVKAGDGVVFDRGAPELKEEGGRVHAVETRGAQTTLRFAREDVRWENVRAGQMLWKTDDPALDRDWLKSYTVNTPRFARPVEIRVAGSVGKPLSAHLFDAGVLRGEVVSEMPLEAARTRPLTEAALRETFGRLGGTPLRLGRLVCALEGDCILPLGELNRMRRALVEQCLVSRENAVVWTVDENAAPPDAPKKALPEPDIPTEWVALVRDVMQLSAALAAGARTLYADFENPKAFADAVAQAHDSGATLWAAPPRVYKDDEGWILRQIERARPDGFLARNPAHLRAFAGAPMRGDFSLNVANPISARYFIETFGLQSTTVSYDLDAEQVCDLLRAFSPQRLEITLHQHMPLFHMAHCVFCAFLAQAKDYRTCGRPCEKHAVHLRDHLGMAHPLFADAGCRNTLYHARAQSGVASLAQFCELGARRFRVEFLNESPEIVRETLGCYREAFAGTLAPDALCRRLNVINRLGVTRRAQS